MDNLPSTSDRNFSFGNILKALASGTTLGAMVVSLINEEQTMNIEDTLQKHKEQLEMLKEMVVGELFVNKEKYIAIKNGKLTVNKRISQLGYPVFICTVRAKATDGSGITCEKDFYVTTPTTYIEVGEYEKLEEEGITYYSIEFKTDSIMEPAVTSSNPDRCSIKMMEYKIDVSFYNEERKSDSTRFEPFAIAITTLADTNIISCDNTRPSRDGGRDGIGEYRIMSGLNQALKTVFAVEAKCYDIKYAVGVESTSRLISRIRHRQFGVLVTTSYVDPQAYKEIIEDEHPIAIIAGVDIIDILYHNEITSLGKLKEYLENNFPQC